MYPLNKRWRLSGRSPECSETLTTAVKTVKEEVILQSTVPGLGLPMLPLSYTLAALNSQFSNHSRHVPKTFMAQIFLASSHHIWIGDDSDMTHI